MTSTRLDLLADIFRRATNHQSGDENRQDDEQKHAVETRTDAADDQFTELHVDERDHAAKRGERVVHGIDGTAGRRSRDNGKQRRSYDTEANLLAFHIAASQPQVCRIDVPEASAQ